MTAPRRRPKQAALQRAVGDLNDAADGIRVAWGVYLQRVKALRATLDAPDILAFNAQERYIRARLAQTLLSH